MVYIFSSLFVLRVSDFNNRNLFLTSILLNKVIGIQNICKVFSKFYHKHSELIVKSNIGFKTHLQKGISESVF